ncbi:hypothetical protein TNCV_2133911 [Trichonephila clavipes]|nr:hypothetical protein TNCV_2133911 [Trichonephila clavipes]
MPWKYQIAFSRFVSGHVKAPTFLQSQKVFPEYYWCYSDPVNPAHILTSLDFKKDEILLDPLVLLEFLGFFLDPWRDRQSEINNNSNEQMTSGTINAASRLPNRHWNKRENITPKKSN